MPGNPLKIIALMILGGLLFIFRASAQFPTLAILNVDIRTRRTHAGRKPTPSPSAAIRSRLSAGAGFSLLDLEDVRTPVAVVNGLGRHPRFLPAGRPADLVILSENIFTINLARISEVKVLAVMDGRIVYRAN